MSRGDLRISGESDERCELPQLDASKRWRLFLKYRASLARLMLLLVDNRDDAADLLQDLGLIVFMHPTGPRDPSCFYAWCRALARNIAVTHWRTNTRRAFQARAVDIDVTDCETSMADPELLSVLHDELAHVTTLDERSRELLQRRYLFGETATEIANTLRTSPASIRMKLKRLRSSLRDTFEERESRPRATDGPQDRAAPGAAGHPGAEAATAPRGSTGRRIVRKDH